MKPATELDNFLKSINNGFTFQKYMESLVEGKVKRNECIAGVFGTFCSDCIIEGLKNRIGTRYPELFQYETHKEVKDETAGFIKDSIAYFGVKELLQEMKLDNFIHVSMLYSFHNPDLAIGNLLIGSEMIHMIPTETLIQFMQRVGGSIASLGLHIKPNFENGENPFDTEEEQIQSNKHDFFIMPMKEMYHTFEDKMDETDNDDFDLGRGEGVEVGYEKAMFEARVAMFKCFSTRDYFDGEDELFATFMEDFNNAVARFSKAPNHFSNWLDRYAEFVSMYEIMMDDVLLEKDLVEEDETELEKGKEDGKSE